MTILVNSVLDFGAANRISNLAAATTAGQPVTYEQLNAAVANISWKDNVRVASQVNTNLSSPGSAIDGVTLTANDRVLLLNQTTASQNGIYIWNGSATPMTRADDSGTFDSLESAVVSIDEGTDSGVTYRQTQVNGTIDSSSVVWVAFGTSAPAASESTAGVVERASQAEVNAGTDDTRFVSPLKLATYSGRALRFSSTVGDGSATSISVTHNLNSEDVQVYVRENGGSKRQIMAEVQHTNANSITVLFDTAPANNTIRITVQG